jgi:hypothetical protein
MEMEWRNNGYKGGNRVSQDAKWRMDARAAIEMGRSMAPAERLEKGIGG